MLGIAVFTMLTAACMAPESRRPATVAPEPDDDRDAGDGDEPLPVGLRALGKSCETSSQCQSGFCAHGLCCNEVCSGLCTSCSLPGSEGRCTNVPAGTDPDDDCTPQAPETCGLTGTCDGEGACALHGRGTSCTPTTCKDATTLETAGQCDGTGTCTAGSLVTCADFTCAAGAGGAECRTNCQTDGDCVPGKKCLQGSCGLKPPGAACAQASECASNFCVDEVCCASACAGACMACNVPGSQGACVAIPAGQDPADECPDDGAGSCKRDGSCDGAGACRQYAAGTSCAAAQCQMGQRTDARTCDGTGTCRAGTTASCGGYQCDGASCRQQCAVDGDCVSPFICVLGECARGCSADSQCSNGQLCVAGRCTMANKPYGQACSENRECALALNGTSRHCVDGVCCNVICNATCKSCATATQPGQCLPHPANTDPDDECPGTMTCNGQSSNSMCR